MFAPVRTPAIARCVNIIAKVMDGGYTGVVGEWYAGARKFSGDSMRKVGVVSGLLLIWFGCGGPQARAQAQQPPVKLEVDLRDATRRIYHAQLEFAVKPGPLTLVYP